MIENDDRLAKLINRHVIDYLGLDGSERLTTRGCRDDKDDKNDEEDHWMREREEERESKYICRYLAVLQRCVSLSVYLCVSYVNFN